MAAVDFNNRQLDKITSVPAWVQEQVPAVVEEVGFYDREVGEVLDDTFGVSSNWEWCSQCSLHSFVPELQDMHVCGQLRRKSKGAGSLLVVPKVAVCKRCRLPPDASQAEIDRVSVCESCKLLTNGNKVLPCTHNDAEHRHYRELEGGAEQPHCVPPGIHLGWATRVLGKSSQGEQRNYRSADKYFIAMCPCGAALAHDRETSLATAIYRHYYCSDMPQSWLFGHSVLDSDFLNKLADSIRAAAIDCGKQNKYFRLTRKMALMLHDKWAEHMFLHGTQQEKASARVWLEADDWRAPLLLAPEIFDGAAPDAEVDEFPDWDDRMRLDEPDAAEQERELAARAEAAQAHAAALARYREQHQDEDMFRVKLEVKQKIKDEIKEEVKEEAWEMGAAVFGDVKSELSLHAKEEVMEKLVVGFASAPEMLPTSTYDCTLGPQGSSETRLLPALTAVHSPDQRACSALATAQPESPGSSSIVQHPKQGVQRGSGSVDPSCPQMQWIKKLRPLARLPKQSVQQHGGSADAVNGSTGGTGIRAVGGNNSADGVILAHGGGVGSEPAKLQAGVQGVAAQSILEQTVMGAAVQQQGLGGSQRHQSDEPTMITRSLSAPVAAPRQVCGHHKRVRALSDDQPDLSDAAKLCCDGASGNPRPKMQRDASDAKPGSPHSQLRPNPGQQAGSSALCTRQEGGCKGQSPGSGSHLNSAVQLPPPFPMKRTPVETIDLTMDDD